ncbi:DUF2291 domain-containing protein [Mariniblastus fucicola]|uniref:Periplasmic lipoprotein n=1 Tax=Mariniblastus fucicola TaxID=980251 RepID=A0A5B9P9L2_9BACT|nr:DUF2291 domain-containing protein [Mariniblastus fucicola]QEG21600.1 hypothetical protein MFFC18_14580 [Mariniblastus fucicola]
MKKSGGRWGIRIALALACVVLLYFFPLFRVVALSDVDTPSINNGAVQFDATTFVDSFWSDKLLPGENKATNIAELITAIEKDKASAKESFGRTVGLSRSYFYFVKGTGRVVKVKRNTIGIAIDESSTAPQVLLDIGPIFGNVVRDGTGLLDVNDFANSQDFNAISTELNRRIEADVQPALREKAIAGANVRFTGCVQITDESSDLSPLRIVPFFAEVP